jgi:hypothetical protein
MASAVVRIIVGLGCGIVAVGAQPAAQNGCRRDQHDHDQPDDDPDVPGARAGRAAGRDAAVQRPVARADHANAVVLSVGGVYSIGIPNTSIWQGYALSTQGFRLDLLGGSPVFLPLNAQDVVMGL